MPTEIFLIAAFGKLGKTFEGKYLSTEGAHISLSLHSLELFHQLPEGGTISASVFS